METHVISNVLIQRRRSIYPFPGEYFVPVVLLDKTLGICVKLFYVFKAKPFLVIPLASCVSSTTVLKAVRNFITNNSAQLAKMYGRAKGEIEGTECDCHRNNCKHLKSSFIYFLITVP